MKSRVIRRDTALHILQEILKNETHSTTLIVCSNRWNSVEQLIPSLIQEPATLNAAGDNIDENEFLANAHTHPLLVPTLQLIANSKRVKLVFCPSIDSLRAFMSTLTASVQAKSHPRASLVVVDLILLHHGTSEFSVQGLMRSLSSAVESAARSQMDLQLCECKDTFDLQNPDRGPKLWDAQAPLLSGSVKLRSEDAGWSRKMVSVRTIASRWFEFERQQERREHEPSQDEEMLV
jgi:hypothetical protein